jgi:hypothetical protein
MIRRNPFEIAAPLHRRPDAQDEVHHLAERQRTVVHEQAASARHHAAAGQVLEQYLGHLGFLDNALAESEHMFPALAGCLGPAMASALILSNASMVERRNDVDDVVEGALGVLEEVEQRQDDSAVLGQQVGDPPGIQGHGATWWWNDLVGFGHRWWPLCKGFDNPMICLIERRSRRVLITFPLIL